MKRALGFLCLFVLASAVAAEQPSSSLRSTASPVPATPQTYGTGAIAAFYSANSFVPRDTAIQYVENGGDKSLSAAGASFQGYDLAAHIDLPAGALIGSIDYFYCDDDAGADFIAFLTRYGTASGDFSDLGVAISSGTPGCGTLTITPASVVTIDNFNYGYDLIVRFGVVGGTQSFRGARVNYTLQVSPAPGTATFLDVPTSHPQFQFIEALVAAGITAGCGSGNYCPDNPLTRGQMAVFLSKALGLNWTP